MTASTQIISGDAIRKSHFDTAERATAIWIYQGDFYVSARKDLYLTTVLGSCIAVCMRDPVTGCGGMNHFLLPEVESEDSHYPSLALRYGSYSIERLTNAILSRGGRRDRLEIKVFGGANVNGAPSNIGGRNVDFVEHYFAREKLRITAADMRGNLPRKLRYFPNTGRAMTAEIRDVEATAAVTTEIAMRSAIDFNRLTGSIDVF